MLPRGKDENLRDEMVDKDGNIWRTDAWPDLVHSHFADVYKAREVEIRPEKRELEKPSNEALQHGGHELLAMVLGLTERKRTLEEYDEHLVADVDGSYVPRNGCKGKRGGMDGRPKQEAKDSGVLDGWRTHWLEICSRAAKQGDRVGGVMG